MINNTVRKSGPLLNYSQTNVEVTATCINTGINAKFRTRAQTSDEGPVLLFTSLRFYILVYVGNFRSVAEAWMHFATIAHKLFQAIADYRHSRRTKVAALAEGSSRIYRSETEACTCNKPASAAIFSSLERVSCFTGSMGRRRTS